MTFLPLASVAMLGSWGRLGGAGQLGAAAGSVGVRLSQTLRKLGMNWKCQTNWPHWDATGRQTNWHHWGATGR